MRHVSTVPPGGSHDAGSLRECPSVFPESYGGIAGEVVFGRDTNILNVSVLNSGRALSSSVDVAANCLPAFLFFFF